MVGLDDDMDHINEPILWTEPYHPCLLYLAKREPTGNMTPALFYI